MIGSCGSCVNRPVINRPSFIKLGVAWNDSALDHDELDAMIKELND